MRRVMVIGISGAGKSTFSRALAHKTGLPLIHLDKEYWQPGWTETPKLQWRARVAELVAGDSWIIDGNYGGSLHLRLPRADTLFWFDYPTLRCLRRVLRRKVEHHGRVREDMGAGCPEQLDIEFLRYVWRFNADTRPKLAAALAEHGRHLHPWSSATTPRSGAFSTSCPDTADEALCDPARRSRRVAKKGV